MKARFIIMILMVSWVMIASNSVSSVPKKVRNAFEAKYAKINSVSWEVDENGNYNGTFPYYEENLTATFTPEGSWVKTTSEVLITDILKCVSAYIQDEYEGSDVFAAQYYEDPVVKKQLQITVIYSKGTLFSVDEEDVNEEDWVISSDEEFEIRYLKLSFDECKFLSSEDLEELN